MSEITTAERPPEPDFETITPGELAAYQNAENHFRASAAARELLGEPDTDALIEWRKIPLPGRHVPVRVYRPAPGGDSAAVRHALPLVLHVHGGGFVGTATQCDWTSSHLAVRLPAVVVSVEHRLLAPDSALPNAAADVWDVLLHLVRHADAWDVDPTRVAIFGESFGALLVALAAIRANEARLGLRAQVLVNPVVDVTEAMFDYPSMKGHARGRARTQPLLRYLRQLAAPPGTDDRTCSPLYADELGGLAPALVVVPTRDALADHGRSYAERLRIATTAVRLVEYPGARHAFLTLPGVEPQAVAAQAEILAFLRATLAR